MFDYLQAVNEIDDIDNARDLCKLKLDAQGSSTRIVQLHNKAYYDSSKQVATKEVV